MTADTTTTGNGSANGSGSSLRSRLRAVFADALDLEPGTAIEELVYRRSTPKWDSLGHMALVAAIEDHFGVQLDTTTVVNLSSFRVAEETLRDLGVAD